MKIIFISSCSFFWKWAFMQFWDPLEATLDQLRVKFCKFGPKMSPTGAILGPFSTNLGPTWAFLVPSWRRFRISWIHFGTHGGCKHETVQLEARSRAAVSTSWVILAPTWGQLNAILCRCGHWRTNLGPTWGALLVMLLHCFALHCIYSPHLSTILVIRRASISLYYIA